MTEPLDFSIPSEPEAAPDAPPAEPSAAQAGAALRRARESKGVHLVALASALKVPTKHLENLEAGNFDALPDLVFAKALAASVCRQMGVDAVEVLRWWPQVANPTLLRTITTTSVKPTTFDPYPDRPKALRRVFVVLALLAIGAGLAWLWWMPAPMPEEATADLGQSVTTTETSPATAGEAPATTSVAAPTGADASGASVETLSGGGSPQLAMPVAESANANAAVLATAAVPATDVSNVQTPMQAAAAQPTPVTSAAPMQAPAMPQAVASTRALVIQVNKEAWLEVRSPSDGVVLSRVVPAGETVQWPLQGGAWSVIVGNAGGVEVRVNGQVRDLTADTRANVARFTLE